jgi:hypothetical protein
VKSHRDLFINHHSIACVRIYHHQTLITHGVFTSKYESWSRRQQLPSNKEELLVVRKHSEEECADRQERYDECRWLDGSYIGGAFVRAGRRRRCIRRSLCPRSSSDAASVVSANALDLRAKLIFRLIELLTAVNAAATALQDEQEAEEAEVVKFMNDKAEKRRR